MSDLEKMLIGKVIRCHWWTNAWLWSSYEMTPTGENGPVPVPFYPSQFPRKLVSD